MPRKNRQNGAKEIRGGVGIGFGGLAAFEEFDDLGEFRLGVADLLDARIAGLDQAEKRDNLQIRGKAGLNKSLGLVFFGRIELGETRAQNMRLPIIRAGADRFLLGAIFHEPNFRAVVARIADQDDAEERIFGLEIDFVVELRDEGTELFKIGNANGFEIRFAGIGGAVDVLAGREKLGEIPVEPNGARLRWNLPLGSAKEDADVLGAESRHARGGRFGFERMVDGAENDGVAGNEDDDAAAGEVGDDFVFLGGSRNGPGEAWEREEEGGPDGVEQLHGDRIPRVTPGGRAFSIWVGIR